MDKDITSVVSFQYFDSRCFCEGTKDTRMAAAQDFASAANKQVPGNYPIKEDDVEVFVNLEDWPGGIAFGDEVKEAFKKHSVKLFD